MMSAVMVAVKYGRTLPQLRPALTALGGAAAAEALGRRAPRLRARPPRTIRRRDRRPRHAPAIHLPGRRGGREVEGSGLENRRTGRLVPWVRIPPPPPYQDILQVKSTVMARQSPPLPRLPGPVRAPSCAKTLSDEGRLCCCAVRVCGPGKSSSAWLPACRRRAVSRRLRLGLPGPSHHLARTGKAARGLHTDPVSRHGPAARISRTPLIQKDAGTPAIAARCHTPSRSCPKTV
jgi:hypothetical protein